MIRLYEKLNHIDFCNGVIFIYVLFFSPNELHDESFANLFFDITELYIF